MTTAQGIKAGRAYVELGMSDKLTAGLRAAQKRLKAFGTGVADLGKRLLTISAIGMVPFFGGAKVFADFQSQMSAVETMLEEPLKHMERFNRGVREMSVEFGESTEALAGGLYDILSASIAPEQALNVLAVSARAAKAGLTDTKVAADAITTILNSYGLAGEKAGDISDWLFSIVKRGKTTFGELAPQIGMVASTAASAGVDLNELGALLATLTRNGVRTTTAVDSVNGIIRSFLKPSDEAAKLARQLGFEMSTVTLQSEGLAGVFARISKLPPDTLAKLFPDSSALRGVIPALKNFEGFGDDMDAMAQRAGTTDAAFGKMSDDLAFLAAQLKQVGALILSEIGESIAGPLLKAGEAARNFGSWIARLIAENQGLVRTVFKVLVVVASLGAGLVIVGGVIIGIGAVIGSLASIITGVVAAFGFVSAAATAIAGALAFVWSHISVTGVVFAALGVEVLYVSGVIQSAIQWIAGQFQQLRDTAMKAFGGIKDALAAGDMKLAASILWLALKVEWQRGIAGLQSLWQNFKGWFLGIIADVGYGALKILAGAWAGIRAAWVITTSFISEWWTKAMGTVKTGMRSAQLDVETAFHRIAGFFDENYDVDAAINIATVNAKADLNAIAGQRDSALADTERQKQSDLAAIGQEYESQRQAIDAASSKDEADRKSRADAAIAESEGNLASARADLDAAIAAAKSKREEQERRSEFSEKGAILPQPAKAKDAIAGGGQALSALAGKISVKGTFNSSVAKNLGSSDGRQDRIVRATESSDKSLRRLVRGAATSRGLTFG